MCSCNNYSPCTIENIDGVIPLIAYAAAYAAILGGAVTAAYYKGYSDAGEAIEPCYETSHDLKYTN